MPKLSPATSLVMLLLLAATVSAFDLRRVEANTLVVYTTPALKEVLEKEIVPSFEAKHGIKVKLIYLPAASEFYRVKMANDRPEADLFLHASPLFIEKGYAEGLFDTFDLPAAAATQATPQRRGPDHGVIWAAVATSPLVEVYNPAFDAPPDLNRTSTSFGFPHPLLSNNGVYATLFFETTDRAAGRKAVDRTVVQPTNAQANMNGAADGTFDVTLGYEAVAKLFKDGKGAQIEYGFPVVNGRNVTLNVQFSLGLVHNHAHAGWQEFIDHIFDPAVQASFSKYDMRPTLPDVPGPADALDLKRASLITYDWSKWQELESRLPVYVVNP